MELNQLNAVKMTKMLKTQVFFEYFGARRIKYATGLRGSKIYLPEQCCLRSIPNAPNQHV